MSRPVPSRLTLRHLARLCAAESLPSTTRPTLCTAVRHDPSSRVFSARRDLSTSRPLHQSPSSSHQASDSTTLHPLPLPNTSSYYTLFPSTLPCGPPPSAPFAIPLPQLRREFLQLQSFYHPDKFPSFSPSSTSLSANNLIALSSLVNTAYRTLSDPLLRAQYLLLHQYNIDVTSEDNSANTTDPQTLMEVMEAQENIESAQTQSEIDNLKSENKIRIEETEAKMGKAFEDEDVESARRECVRLKYWRSLQQGLNDWEMGKEVRLVH